MQHDAAVLLLQVRVRSQALFRSFDFVRIPHDTTAAAVYSARYYRSAAVRGQQIVPAAIVPTDLVCTGQGFAFKQDA